MSATCRSGWSTEGCEKVSVTESHVTCQCWHLTAFAAILPAAAFQVYTLMYVVCNIILCELKLRNVG